MKRISIWIKLLYWYFCSFNCNRRAKLLTAEETADKALQNNLCLIRLGDGELNCLENLDVHYQRADENLKKEMEQLITCYMKNPDSCGYLLCMPNGFLKCGGFELAKKRVWVSSWARFRFVFKKYFDKNIEYGDAFLFAKKHADIYSKLWDGAENVIFVHNDKKYADIFAQKYKKAVEFIGIPKNDCYSQIDLITENIKEAILKKQDPQKTVVLISAGPCAKAIVFRLKDIGVRIIDTGHCFDDPLQTR